MSKTTALNEKHRESHAKMVDFSGWDMPIHYGSQIEEHHQVRRDAGVFDVSHMTIVDITGEQSRTYLQTLLANDINKLREPGKALYSCMLTPEGGVIDDLIVYYLSEDWFRMVVNAATHDKDMAWLNQIAADFDINLHEQTELAMLAVQGPNARDKTLQALGNDYAAIADLKPFYAYHNAHMFIGRTGYTGEDGYELMLPNDQAPQLWDKLLALSVKPIGLGARDTLRLEAGMSLYGQEMDETVSPLESGLSWTVSMQASDPRPFIGRAALEKKQAAGLQKKLVGLILEDKGVLRHGQTVLIRNIGEGVVTSGSYSPTLGVSIGLASVPVDTGNQCQVVIRNKFLNAKVVKPPFVRFGKACYKE